MCLLCLRLRAKGAMSCQFSPQFPLLSSSDAAITQTCQKQDDTEGRDKKTLSTCSDLFFLNARIPIAFQDYVTRTRCIASDRHNLSDNYTD